MPSLQPRSFVDAVMVALKQGGARRVIDVACGDGRLLEVLVKERRFDRVAGMDTSLGALELVRQRLGLTRPRSGLRQRVDLFQGAVIYRDERLRGYDAACALDVLEELEHSKRELFEEVIFGFARPGIVIVSASDADCSHRVGPLARVHSGDRASGVGLPQAAFRAWAHAVGERFGYAWRLHPVDLQEPDTGPALPLAVFVR